MTGRSGDLMFIARVAEDYETVLDFLLFNVPSRRETFTVSETMAQELFLGRTVAEAAHALLAKPDL